MFLQQQGKFIGEASFTMMFFLAAYVVTDSVQVGGTHAERSISGLPGKKVTFFVHPL